MPTLYDHLRELADEAPSGLPDRGLWDRGWRYRRVRRSGTVAIVVVAVLALALLGGVTWERSVVERAPASREASPALPDRIWSPSPWLRGTDDAGPLGPLVALVSAERGGWTGKEPALVGVSAFDGEYRFLDLPDAVEWDNAALSPDGLHVAYWLTGETTGAANTDFRDAPVTGVAIYDTSTGDVRRLPVETEHGLEPEVLGWADGSRLVFSAAQILGGPGDSEMDRSMSRSGTVRVWSLEAEEPVPLDAGGRSRRGVLEMGGGRVVVHGTRSRYSIVDVTRTAPARALVVRATVSTDPVLDNEGRRLAVVSGAVPGEPGHSRNPNRVLAGTIAVPPGSGSARAHLREVPASGGTFRVLSWLDRSHMAVVRRTGACCGGVAVVKVDTRSGDEETMVRLPRDWYLGHVQFAVDLLGATSVPAHRPPAPVDPRWVAGLGAATLGGALAGVVLWRRRVRP
jgi:hypothetical protein